MSSTKSLYYDIQEMCIDGMSSTAIARELDIPVEQVVEIFKDFGVVETQQKEFEDF